MSWAPLSQTKLALPAWSLLPSQSITSMLCSSKSDHPKTSPHSVLVRTHVPSLPVANSRLIHQTVSHLELGLAPLAPLL